MEFLKQAKELEKRNEENLNEAIAELNSLKNRKDTILKSVNTSRSNLKTKFSIKDKANILTLEAELKQIENEINVMEKIIHSMDTEKIDITSVEVKEQFKNYINDKYNHIGKINEVSTGINELIALVNELDQMTKDIRVEANELKPYVRKYTNIPQEDPRLNDRYDGIKLSLNMQELYDLSGSLEVKYELGKIQDKITSIILSLGSF